MLDPSHQRLIAREHHSGVPKVSTERKRCTWSTWNSTVYFGYILDGSTDEQRRNQEEYTNRTDHVLVIAQHGQLQNHLAANALDAAEVRELQREAKSLSSAGTSIRLVKIAYEFKALKDSPYDDARLAAVPQPTILQELSLDEFTSDAFDTAAILARC
jgi:hypothetical protein